MKISRKRLLLSAGGITAVAAVATLVLGSTLGLFSSAPVPQGNTFTAGTVSLNQNLSQNCTVGPMAPGDSSTGWTPAVSGQTDPQSAPCILQFHYTGNLPAYIGVDILTAGGLYDGTSNGLQLSITDGSTSYATGGHLNGPVNGGPDYLFSTTPDIPGASHTITVTYALPTTSPNMYQGLNTTLTIVAHAVQSGNNNFVGACTAGNQCPGPWS